MSEPPARVVAHTELAVEAGGGGGVPGRGHVARGQDEEVELGEGAVRAHVVRCAVSAATNSCMHPVCEAGSASGGGAGLGRAVAARFRPTRMMCARPPRCRANASRMPCPMPEVPPTNMAVGV